MFQGHMRNGKQVAKGVTVRPIKVTRDQRVQIAKKFGLFLDLCVVFAQAIDLCVILGQGLCVLLGQGLC